MSASAMGSSSSLPLFAPKMLKAARSVHLRPSRQSTQETLDNSPERPPRYPRAKPTVSEVHARTCAFLTSQARAPPSQQHLFGEATQKTCREKIDRRAKQTLVNLLDRHGSQIIQKIIDKRSSWDPHYARVLAHIRTSLQSVFADSATQRTVVAELNDIKPVHCCTVERLTATWLQFEEDEIVIDLDCS